ncbi:MAG: phosphoenolpyruvate--protein phosphotransferase [Micrococcaceae bacterium]
MTGSKTLTGIGVGSGVAISRVLKMGEALPEPEDVISDKPVAKEKEIARDALANVAKDLRERGEKAGDEAKQVLDAQALMAEDPGLVPAIDAAIGNGKTAQRAIFESFMQYREMLKMAGGYMAERVADLDDVRQRAVAAAVGVQAPGVPESDSEFILIASDLAPADTALLDLNKVKALVTQEGGPTSHTAILARAKGIPAVVGVETLLELEEETEVIVDAGLGKVLVNPDKDAIAKAKKKQETLSSMKIIEKGEGKTKDGQHIALMANVGSAKDAPEAIEADVEGVGLFRTEFLFLDSDTPPSYEKQYEAYKELFDAFSGKKVVARTLDAGADKPLSFLNFNEEPNPALGERGIRVCRNTPDIFETQIKALADAAKDSEADVWVMAPMIVDAEETKYFVDLCNKFGIKHAGCMVETPSSALLADQILEIGDFASIGTNDLTQYTLAADRMLAATAGFQDPWHPAVLRAIGMTAKAGKKNDKTVGVCGEAAADEILALVLTGLGVSYLSMSAPAVAQVRTHLAEYTMEEMEQMAEAAVNSIDTKTAKDAVNKLLHSNL